MDRKHTQNKSNQMIHDSNYFDFERKKTHCDDQRSVESKCIVNSTQSWEKCEENMNDVQ